MKKPLADALAEKGYDTLTPVQQAVSDPDLDGRDLLVSSQTGSGKTIGFGLAIAPTLLGEDDSFAPADAPLALVITPTRELALQVQRELRWLFHHTGAWFASCVGGMDMRDERRTLARGADIVVATPGRLCDHIRRGSIDLSAVRAVVLDEADQMLDLGFREDLEFILEETPPARQTLLFSATVPPGIEKLAQAYQKDAERISTVSKSDQHADIEYRALMVAPSDAENAVINLLRYYEAPNAIVFCNTRAKVARLTSRLANRGLHVVALSGELTQAERTNALQAMRDGRARICVATDVAARGIDLPGLDLVVHAELPKNAETLLHRSGRTGRAGRKGVSALLVVPSERKKTEKLMRWAKLDADWGTVPGAADVDARDQERMMASDRWSDPVTEAEAGAVSQLVDAFSTEQLAAAFLREFRLRHAAPEDMSPIKNRAEVRQTFGPSVWFEIAAGEADGVTARTLLPVACKAGGITRDDIGAIRIAAHKAYLEIRAEIADDFQGALGSSMAIWDDAATVRLEGAPDLAEVRSKPMGRGPKERVQRRKPSGPRRHTDEGGKLHGASRGGKLHGGQASGKPRGDAPAKRKPEGGAGPRGASEKVKERSTERVKPAGDWSKKGKDGKPAPRQDLASEASGKPKRPKGPPPPKGKPSSKKNRARTAAAKGIGKGGNAVPKRK